jgi:4-aminobutyrate aminotransferase-like enzyme
MAAENLVQQAADVGSYVTKQLENMQNSYSFMDQTRGQGTLIAFDLDTPERAWRFVDSMLQKGINVGVCREKVIRIRPALVFAKAHADIFLNATEDTLKEIK